MHLRLLIATLWLLMAPTVCSLAASPPSADWEEAARLASAYREAWTEVWLTLDVEPAECEAVIFPELLRYNRVRDGVELAGLLALYVQGGIRAANFSVGMFQIKPSFAEEVERAWMKSPLRHTYRLYFDTSDNRVQRGKRVERLRDERWQCVYLALFVRLLLEREPSWTTLDAAHRIRLLATAYNYRFSAAEKELQERYAVRSFHLDLLRTRQTICYNYAELAVRHWRELSDNKL